MSEDKEDLQAATLELVKETKDAIEKIGGTVKDIGKIVTAVNSQGPLRDAAIIADNILGNWESYKKIERSLITNMTGNYAEQVAADVQDYKELMSDIRKPTGLMTLLNGFKTALIGGSGR